MTRSDEWATWAASLRRGASVLVDGRTRARVVRVLDDGGLVVATPEGRRTVTTSDVTPDLGGRARGRTQTVRLVALASKEQAAEIRRRAGDEGVSAYLVRKATE